jgi:hypothetical protein
MNSNRTEYLPTQGEQTPGQQRPGKVFNLVPAEDSRTRIIIEARTSALEDGELHHGARNLFCRLLDLSLSWYTNRADGVVCISVTKLSEMLKCSARSIYNWNKQLVARRHLWVTEQRMPNMWPVNTYHIAALDSPDEPHQMPTKDGLWGNGVRRNKPLPGEGARGIPLNSLHASNQPNSPVLPENAGESCTEQHASAANFAAGSGKVCHGEPQKTARGSRKVCGGESQNVQRGAAKKSTRPPNETAVNRETVEEDNSPKSSLSVKLSAELSSPLCRKGGESEFLIQVSRVMLCWSRPKAEQEMHEWGGWWRNRFREDSDKAHRVLADIHSQIREKKITQDPGKAAHRLWKEFK